MNKENIKGLMHIAGGLLVLYRGFEKFENGKLLPAALFMTFAIICILVAAIHKSITRRFVQADTAFFLLESLTLLYSAWHFKSLEQNILYFIYGILGITFLIFSLLSINDAEKPRSKRRRKHRKTHSKLHSITDTSTPAMGNNDSSDMR